MQSRGFPGFWLAVTALLVSNNMQEGLPMLQQGLRSSEHTAFRARPASRG